MSDKPKWYVLQFDRAWVKCSACRTDFFYDDIKKRRKCPKCKINNQHCRTQKTAPRHSIDWSEDMDACIDECGL